MSNRALTLAEIKVLIDELAAKVTAEGAELYAALKNKIEELNDDVEVELGTIREKIDELTDELDALWNKVSTEGQAIIEKIETRISDLRLDVEDEIAELEEKGLVVWIKDNKILAGSIAAAIAVFVVAVIVLV